jgi:hypothetical protein
VLRYKLFFVYILPQKIAQRRFETALEAHSKELYLALVLAGAEKLTRTSLPLRPDRRSTKFVKLHGTRFQEFEKYPE